MEASSPQAAEQPALDLEWRPGFDTREELRAISLVNEAVKTPVGPRSGGLGVIYRFAHGENAMRFLLLTYIADKAAADSTLVAALFVLQVDEPRISKPLIIGRWALGHFGPVEIADFNGDGELDVAYCRWPEDESKDGIAMANGFGTTGWYPIPQPIGNAPRCRASEQ